MAARRSASFLALPVRMRPWRLASARRASRSALRFSASAALIASASAASRAASSSWDRDAGGHFSAQA